MRNTKRCKALIQDVVNASNYARNLRYVIAHLTWVLRRLKKALACQHSDEKVPIITLDLGPQFVRQLLDVFQAAAQGADTLSWRIQELPLPKRGRRK